MPIRHKNVPIGGNGNGVGPIEKIYRAILDIHRPLELLAISGRNAEAKASLEKVPVPPQHRAHVLGFTDQIDEMMAMADLVPSSTALSAPWVMPNTSATRALPVV